VTLFKTIGKTRNLKGIAEPVMAMTVTTKGQVTIPKPIRDRLGIGPGSTVEFKIAWDGRIVLTRADGTPPPASRFERLRGRATTGLTTEQIMALSRGED
jgi:AbrB family looped-hinge helix DNA binding protein